MIELTMDTVRFDRQILELEKSITDARPMLRIFDRAWKLDATLQVNNNAKATGGTVRGAKWAGFAPQYTRKDGTVVPAWGGIAKVRGEGTVQGKLRPSGQRVSSASIITKDTQQYMNALLSSRPQLPNNFTLEIGGADLVEHGRYQNAMRSIVHWDLPKDQTMLDTIAERWLNELVAKASK